MAAGRESSNVARLARLGFADTAKADSILREVPVLEQQLEIIRLTADPDLALATLGELLSHGADYTSWDESGWERVAHLCGASQALGQHLIKHPIQTRAVASALEIADSETIRSTMLSAVHGLTGDAALDALRVAYRREVAMIAAVDVLAGEESVNILPGVAQALSDLADAVLESALTIAQNEIARANDCRFAVVALGKCGARELNYVSDVDVMFIVAPMPGVDESDALEIGRLIAQFIMRACNTATSEGTIWEVDANLRPEGKSGALVRTLESYLDYYKRWAQTWEFQALLKARAMAGDRELGAAFVEETSVFVWEASSRPNFVEDVQAMRRRVTDLIPAKEAERELKLGRGGLRDVEFAVQLLQLVHGRSDVMVRSPSTLLALEQLATWGYVAREDASSLSAAYRFLRTLEHRIQLHRMRRTHVLPEDPTDLRRLGRSMGFSSDSVDELLKQWKRHSNEVRRIHEKVFYRPLLQAVAKLDSGDARLTPDAAASRLRALGYVDSEGALRHIEALTSGVSRRAVIQRTLLPVMLQWFADGPDPDSGLLGFRRLSEALGTTPWYLRLLRDESSTAERLAHILASSRYVSDLLMRAPEAVNILASVETLQPRTRDELLTEAQVTAKRYPDPVDAVAALRAMRRRELLRTGAADVLGLLTLDQVGEALTDITDATIDGALQAIMDNQSQAVPFCVIAMGRYGGAELGYGSDADVMFCFDDSQPGLSQDESLSIAHTYANELRTLLMAPSTDPELSIDADLRPEGKNGPLVRSLDSFASYYERWSSGWEVHALLRADNSGGDKKLGECFINLINPLRYKAEGLSDSEHREIKRLKARMEAERLPRGIDPALHLKLGPGGLSDVEWLVQVVQLQHAARIPELQTTRTLQALNVATEYSLISREDATTLSEAWLLATRVRNAIVLIKGRPSDVLPSDLLDLGRVAHLMGFGHGSGQALMENYRRTTRRARVVVEKLFFD